MLERVRPRIVAVPKNDPHHAPPRLLVGFLDRGEAEDSCAVHEHVDRSERPLGECNRLGPAVLARDVQVCEGRQACDKVGGVLEDRALTRQNRPRLRPARRRWFALDVERTRKQIAIAETGLYVVVGGLLLVAGLLILYDNGDGFIDGLRVNESGAGLGLRILDRILLLLIIAELLYTLRVIIDRGEISAEPFLFIGIIAVVRRVVVITAETEALTENGRVLTNFLLELGMLALLVIAFGVAIYLIRRSASQAREVDLLSAAATTPPRR